MTRKRPNRGIAAALVCSFVALAVVTLATPASAGACQAGPMHGDGRIRAGMGNYKGVGIYNCDGLDQTVTRDIGPGERKTFDVRYENDCTEIFHVKLRGQLEGDTSDFKVKVLRPDKGNKNVTEKFFNSRVRYRSIEVGDSTPRLRIVIKGLPTVEAGDQVTVVGRGQLDGEGSDLWDTVHAVGGLPA